MKQTFIVAALLAAVKAEWQWLGINESGMEWGTVFPGTEGVDYFVPSTTTIGVSIYVQRF
jgi:hypothetical protein